MDPDANLEQLRRVAAAIERKVDANDVPEANDAAELSELVIALDNWLSNGGFLPRAWQKKGG